MQAHVDANDQPQVPFWQGNAAKPNESNHLSQSEILILKSKDGANLIIRWGLSWWRDFLENLGVDTDWLPCLLSNARWLHTNNTNAPLWIRLCLQSYVIICLELKTRLTYKCAHLRSTKESLKFEYDISWYWVSRRRYWLVLGGAGSV